jgi:RNA polymerase sigma-70 factor (ECF subfamily)
MDEDKHQQHLSQISTLWTLLARAHEGAEEEGLAAKRIMLERYSAPVYRYLLAAVRSPDTADELFQEFALRVVRGDFRGANPQRGRFRSYLKTSLQHLIIDFTRKRRHVSLTDSTPEPAAEESSLLDSDREFQESWRTELMNRAWTALAQLEQQTGQPLHTVLRFRTDHPLVRSPQMAEQLAPLLGQSVSPEWVRKRLFLAREKFTDFLLAEVALSLENPTVDELEQELTDLGLLNYCQAALLRWREKEK